MDQPVNQERLLQIISGQDRSVFAGMTRVGLRVPELAYRIAISARNRLFDLGLRSVARLAAPTISVGNLTTGGTGKTPMVAELARRLLQMGHRPVVLVRGYGDGDEAAELHSVLNGSVPVLSNPNRVLSAQQALKQLSTDDSVVFLLDDAFQHRQVARNLDVVLIDATLPFGYGSLLPRGLLREPTSNLCRADAIIVTRADQASPERLEELDDRIADLNGTPPIAHLTYRWGGIEQLADQTVVGACGIGNPMAFQWMLDGYAGRVLRCEVFKDHHPYTATQVRDLLRRARADGATTVVTTGKDWIKWRKFDPEKMEPTISIVRPQLIVHFLDGGDAIHALLRKVANAGRFGGQ